MPARPSEAFGDETASIKSAVAVNAAVDTTFTGPTRGLYLGASGNVSVQFIGDAAPVTLTGLAAGVWHPMQLGAIFASGTTAVEIVAGF